MLNVYMTCGIPLPRCTLCIDKGTLDNNSHNSEKTTAAIVLRYTAEVIGT